MTDPISAKMASQMANQTSGADDKLVSADEVDLAETTSFEDVFAEVRNRPVDDRLAVDGVEVVQPAAEADQPAEARLRKFLDGFRADETRLDDMMSKSLSGADMSQRQLLQMQSLIYAYSQKVELVSKTVSNASSGMKQIMNTQV